MLKRDHDPALDIFDQGIAVLWQGDDVAGHVATTLSTFWSPGRPLTRQDWVWLLIVWSDGAREYPFEDYPPWTTRREIQAGFLTWDQGDREGTYRAVWVPDDQRQSEWARLGIAVTDF